MVAPDTEETKHAESRMTLGAVIVVIVLVGLAFGAGFILSTTPAGTPQQTVAAPTVTFTAPAYATTGAPINTKILATFSDAMDPSTITSSTFTLKEGATSVSGTVSRMGMTATFAPSSNLAASTAYTATITTGAKDSSGNALAVNFVWGFTTGLVADTTPARVASTSPVFAVALNGNVSATFVEAMDPLTITVSTFLLKQGTTSVSGIVSYAGLTATFDPANDLASNTVYAATITTGATDLAGNALQSGFVWGFTTSTSQSACSQTPITLGLAADFAVLAGSTVTNTGATTVIGDLGLSPGTAVTGFPPGTVVGTIHAGNPTAAGAIADLTIAYNDAAGRTICPIIVAGNVGGLTLTPGLYRSTSSLEISSGDLTLDAQGNSSGVFILQMASTLTTSTGRQVILAGGARASNVFWQVGSSATLGTYSTFVGTLIASQSISFVTGATLDGRALALNAAVTLDTNTVTMGPVRDTTAPLVTFTSPAYGATGVPVNSKILATFSEGMDPLAITVSTFLLEQGTTPVSGLVSWAGLTATFDPASDLAPSTTYTATITTGANDLSGNPLQSNFVWGFTTSTSSDTTPPLVTFTSPAYGATGVPVNSKILATFSEAMDPLTITASTVMLMQGTTPVSGIVTYVGLTATFDPASDLASSTAYTATITTAANDPAGNALQSNFVWGFTTGPAPDTTAPLVTFTSPAYGATGVPVNTKILATFSEAMDPLAITVSIFLLKQGTTPVSGIVTYAGLTATFDPASDLAPSTTYTATITTGAKDLSGNALLINFVWGLTTGPIPDTTPPLVASTSPVLAVPVDSNIAATFDEAMDPLTITTSTFLLKQGATAVSGLVSYAGLTATFDPASDLAPSTTYTATITTGAKDLAGNALQSDFVWDFTTSTSSSACSQAPITLGLAAGFAVLAGSTVTNTGATTVTGDLGLSPGTAVTGFPPGTVVGTIHAGNPTAAGAIADLTIAYSDAAGRTLCPITVAGNLGGLTLTPGLYRSTSSLAISSGDLTLDAQGNSSAVFIFQMASTLTVTAGRHVILTGGAKASNVFWQVGSSATLGTNSIFVGTIMASQSISFVTGATLDGRALALNAAVTLDTNTVTKPAP